MCLYDWAGSLKSLGKNYWKRVGSLDCRKVAQMVVLEKGIQTVAPGRVAQTAGPEKVVQMVAFDKVAQIAALDKEARTVDLDKEGQNFDYNLEERISLELVKKAACTHLLVE